MTEHSFDLEDGYCHTHRAYCSQAQSEPAGRYAGHGKATEDTVELALAAYIECALWSSVGEDGEPLDRDYDASAIDDETRAQMREDVENFLAACWGDAWEGFSIDLAGIEPAQIGHDFWLTRNHHGAGFWDRGLGERGDRLTDLAHGFGGADLYVTDDGQIAGL
jgi:hypothetical protein